MDGEGHRLSAKVSYKYRSKVHHPCICSTHCLLSTTRNPSSRLTPTEYVCVFKVLNLPFYIWCTIAQQKYIAELTVVFPSGSTGGQAFQENQAHKCSSGRSISFSNPSLFTLSSLVDNCLLSTAEIIMLDHNVALFRNSNETRFFVIGSALVTPLRTSLYRLLLKFNPKNNLLCSSFELSITGMP
jgi:hypothetical protein